MAKKRRRYYDTLEAVKSHQHVANRKSRVVIDWEIRDMFLDDKDNLVARRRGRVGYVERRKKR